MRIVITGATSFVGAASVKELLSEGHEVIAVVRPSSKNLDRILQESEAARTGSRTPGSRQMPAGAETEEGAPRTSAGRLTIVENELGEAGTLVEKIQQTCDVFCHFGWGGSGSGARNDEALQEVNMRAALETMHAAKALGCKRFLFSGSQAEYGMHYAAMTEETACSPRSAYGRAKLTVRKEGETLCRSLGMEYIHLRIFSVYGPGDHPWTLVESCLEHFLGGTELLLGPCTQDWNFLYIDDLAKAVCQIAKMPFGVLEKSKNPVLNLAGEETKPLREFVEEIYAVCNGTGSYRFGARADNAEGAVNLIPDIRKIKEMTGWKPETTFKAGIQECIRRRQTNKKAITLT